MRVLAAYASQNSTNRTILIGRFCEECCAAPWHHSLLLEPVLLKGSAEQRTQKPMSNGIIASLGSVLPCDMSVKQAFKVSVKFAHRAQLCLISSCTSLLPVVSVFSCLVGRTIFALLEASWQPFWERLGGCLYQVQLGGSVLQISGFIPHQSQMRMQFVARYQIVCFVSG